jgi:organic radical activating enzyme
LCDTDYRVHERVTADEIAKRARPFNARWTWVTGGEPADYELWSLLEQIRLLGHVAVATSGTKSLGRAARLIDFLSVSPHGAPADLVVQRGAQINLVPGLNGLRLDDWQDFDPLRFDRAFVTPPWSHNSQTQPTPSRPPNV